MKTCRLTIHDLTGSRIDCAIDHDAVIGILREEFTGSMLTDARILSVRAYQLQSAAEENGGVYADLWEAVKYADFFAKQGDHGYGRPNWQAAMAARNAPITFDVAQ